MADPQISIDRQRQLELMALAELELEQEMAAAPAAPAEPTTFMEDFGTNLLAAGKSAVEGVKNTPKNLLAAGEALLSPIDTGKAMVEAVQNQSVPQSIAQGFGATVGNLPIVGPALTGLVQTFADKSDEIRGLGPAMTGEEQAAKFGEVTSGMMAGDAVMRGIGATARAVKNRIPEPIKNIGRNEKAIYTEAAQRPGVTGNILNAPSGTTARKAQAIYDIQPLEQHLLESGVLKGLDTSKANRIQVFQKYLKELEKLRKEGLARKTAILDAADRVSDVSKSRITLKNISRAKLKKLIDEDLTSAFTADDAKMAMNVGDELTDTFVRDTGLVDPSENKIFRNVHFSPSEVAQMVKGIDKKIEQLGAYDQGFLAKAMTDEKTYANIRARLEALRTVRSSLDDALKGHVKATLGDDAVAAIERANMDIRTGIEYGNLGKKFFTETGESWTPGSGRSVNSVVNNSKPIHGHVLHKFNEAMSGYEGLNREATAIKRLQMVAGARGIPGYETPRLLDAIVPAATRAVSKAAPETIRGVYNTLLLRSLQEQGYIAPEQAETGVYGSDIPPEVMEQTVADVDEVVAPLVEAAKFGTDRDMQIVLSNMVRDFPDAFPPPKTGIPGEIEIDGKPALIDPGDKLMFGEMLRRDRSMKPNEKTKILDELHRYDTISNLPRSLRGK